jgi:hypothetical protein
MFITYFYFYFYCISSPLLRDKSPSEKLIARLINVFDHGLLFYLELLIVGNDGKTEESTGGYK